MKLKLPFEITKFFDTKLNPETGKKEISLKRDYAYPIEENFKAIKKYFNNLIDIDNFKSGELTAWTNWTPSYNGTGDMTLSNIFTNIARYCKIDKMVFFVISTCFDIEGVASWGVKFTVPIEPFASIPLGHYGGGCYIEDGTSVPYIEAGNWYFNEMSPSKISVCRYDTQNWSLGVARGMTVQGFYQID